MRIVVIGAGFGGLAAAIRLQAQGHQVTIVEKLDKAGGRAYVFEQDGFTFDAGPTIITARWVFDDLFALTGRATEDFVTLVHVDPFYRIRFEDGSVFEYSGDRKELLRQVEAFSPADVQGYAAFREEAWRIFNAGMPLIDQPFLTIGSMIPALPDMVRTRADRSVADLAARHLHDPRLQQIFSFHPLFVGGNPFDTTSVYALIHKLEQQWGVLFAMGGTGALVRGLVQAFEQLGGTIRYEAEATSIAVDQGRRATGVTLANGESLAADAVVCNGDVVQAHRRLLPPHARSERRVRRLERLKMSMSLFVLYFGTDRQYPDMQHHEILMGPRYRGLLEDIFDRKVLADDFSLYLHRPTATDPSLAPPGCDCWYVLSPVPHLGGGIDWETAGPRYRDRIVDYLEQRYLPNLRQHIVSERVVDPRYFERTLESYLGSAFGPQPVLMQSAWMRPHNRSPDVPNLYFCGAGTHPGAGLPGVVSSGKIVADLIGPPAPTTHNPKPISLPK